MLGNASPSSLSRDQKLQAARLFLAAGRFAEAWGVYESEPARHFGREIALEAAMVAITAGRAADAFEWFGDLRRGEHERTAYWWARLAQQAGHGDLARPVLEQIASRGPGSYYATWATARLRDAGPIKSPIGLDGRATRQASDVPAASVALVELGDVTRRHGAAIPQLQRALELAQAGSAVAASQELRQAFKLSPRTFDRGDQAIVARVARVLGDEELALRLQPAENLRDYHRHAWRDLVVAAAARHEIDPDLVWSIMLRESYFRPNAASPAGAMGLMQIMPETGRAIARELDVRGFSPNHLLEPDCAIDFGAFLLAGLLHRYDGNVPVAVAAYNAGIGPVDEWLAARRGVDADVFAELIPYPETHRYVRRVLTSLALYQAVD
jgi:soluble lytic murein transglycosylase